MLVWAVSMIVQIFGFRFKFMVVSVVALFMTLANLYGYYRC